MPLRPDGTLLIALVALVIAAFSGSCGRQSGSSTEQEGETVSETGSSTLQDDGTASETDSITVEDSGASDSAICVQSEAAVAPESRPVDIILVIDNSGSMSSHIRQAEHQLNKNFSAIVDSAVPAVDYRVVMLSRYGASSNSQICVAEPLGGIPDADSDGHCDTVPAVPANTAKFFHYSRSVTSHNALCLLLSSFSTPDMFNLLPSGYGAILRPEAFKFLMVITDDGVSCASYNDKNSVSDAWNAASAFDADLRALSPEHFGQDAQERRYSLWGILSLSAYLPTAEKPYGDPHPPDDAMAPVTTMECIPSPGDPGTGYQALAVLTGGYRYPICGPDYTDIFQRLSQGVIQKAKAACEFQIPQLPGDETLDLETVQVRYSSGGQEKAVFNPATNLAECSKTENQFYIDGNLIELCPSACALVQNDPSAEIAILYGCELNISRN
jgi:hypothetical protein